MKKKIIALCLACLLLFGTAFAQSGAADLIDAFAALALSTENVTIDATAEFSLDGEWFKTMRAVYKQSGYDSYLEYMLDTPLADGTVYTGGYTVIGIDDMAYANDTDTGNLYYSITNEPSDTILTDNAANRAAVIALKACAASAEGLLDEFTAEPDGEGTKYTIKCVDLPDIADSALYYLAANYLNDDFGVDLTSNVYDPYVTALYEDYEAVLADAYRTIFGEDMPVSCDDETLSGRYSVAAELVDQREVEETVKYESGYVWFKADGTPVYYATEEELRRAVGKVHVAYEDYEGALCACYKAVYGEELTDEELTALYMTWNEDLSEAFYGFIDNLDTYYSDAARALDPNAVACKVLADGTLKVYDHMPIDLYFTPAKALLYNTVFASLKDVDLTVTLDGEGRVTSVSGSLTIEATDGEGRVYGVGVKFSGSCSGYGETYVSDEFDADEYGWINYDEYTAQQQSAATEDEAEDEPLPDTITFMGTEYDTLINSFD